MLLRTLVSTVALAFTLTGCGAVSEGPDASTLAGTPLSHRECGYGSSERNDGVLGSMEQEILRQANEFRAQNGLPAFAQHNCIGSVAYFHSVNMAKQKNASHVLDGKDPRARLVEQDMNLSYWGENIQTQWWTRNGQPHWDSAAYPGLAMGFWKSSPGHRANLLNPNFRYLGVGISKTEDGAKGSYYATQVFMTE